MVTEADEKLFQRLEDRVERHEISTYKKFEKLITAQEENTKAISKLTESVSSVVKGTSAIIQLHQDIQGAARIGKGVQGFMLWSLKWGVIGTGITTAIMWLVEHFKS